MSKNQDKTKVTRITASGDAPTAASTPKAKAAKSTPAAPSKTTKKSALTRKKRSWGALGRIGGYFKGAWLELRQVHWPTRAATWGLTSAVLLFSAFFVVFITLLDAGFKYLFEQILR